MQHSSVALGYSYMNLCTLNCLLQLQAISCFRAYDTGAGRCCDIALNVRVTNLSRHAGYSYVLSGFS